MRKLLTGLLIASLLVSAGCEPPRHSRRKHKKQNITVFHLNDGRYCYHDETNNAWYWMIRNSSVDDFYTGPSPTSGELRPSGYSWHQVVNNDTSLAIPSGDEISQILQDEPSAIIQEEIVIDERGYPEVDVDGNLVDPDQLAPDNGYGPDIDTPDSGPDSGGDGGGGDGGGDSGSGD